ncbi:helix-turn-helix transcriptional regulator [Shimia sp. MIT1388]|uniref:helix-turn-helix transcriptional regulator n=1 Tax=Shimia sp. MIT1388 TaxID=3096992 RepID=UPI00399AB8F6
MRRTERLFQIIQVLRAARAPVTGRELAVELEVSLRTLYRDMAELIAQRVPITGEAGMGYVLDEGYDMPPLMLTADELEAAVLGAGMVAGQADPTLARAARDLVAKLTESIPEELRPVVLDASSRAIVARGPKAEQFDGARLRVAIRERFKVRLSYRDGEGRESQRVIWPLLIAYFVGERYIVAWCETRQDYRHFRTDRIATLDVLNEGYPGRRASLIAGWDEVMAKRKAAS